MRYFFLMDQVEKGNLRITYCPTDDMTADYMMKSLQGEKFRKFRAEISRRIFIFIFGSQTRLKIEDSR